MEKLQEKGVVFPFKQGLIEGSIVITKDTLLYGVLNVPDEVELPVKVIISNIHSLTVIRHGTIEIGFDKPQELVKMDQSPKDARVETWQQLIKASQPASL